VLIDIWYKQKQTKTRATIGQLDEVKRLVNMTEMDATAAEAFLNDIEKMSKAAVSLVINNLRVQLSNEEASKTKLKALQKLYKEVNACELPELKFSDAEAGTMIKDLKRQQQNKKPFHKFQLTDLDADEQNVAKKALEAVESMARKRNQVVNNESQAGPSTPPTKKGKKAVIEIID
jgi:hypothetical protein